MASPAANYRVRGELRPPVNTCPTLREKRTSGFFKDWLVELIVMPDKAFAGLCASSPQPPQGPPTPPLLQALVEVRYSGIGAGLAAR
jgi:hypothetical protein